MVSATIGRAGLIAGLRAVSLVFVCLTGYLLIGQAAFAQQAPGVDWRLTDWYPFKPSSGPQPNQDLSGEDWWYDHKNSYVFPSTGNPIPNGYICAGYSNWPELLLGDETGSGGCFKPAFGAVICGDFETANNRRGSIVATLALVDHSGNAVWHKTYNDGYFYRVIQTSDGGYLAAGITAATRTPNGSPLFYNPNQTAGSATDSFNNGAACQLGDNRAHMVLVKTFGNGTVQWQYVYGVVPFRIGTTDNSVNSYKSASEAWDLIETPSGDFRIVGNATDASTPFTCGPHQLQRSFMIEVGSNGDWHWGQFYGLAGTRSNFSGITMHGTGAGLKYVVSGTEWVPGSQLNPHSGCNLYQSAHVMQFDNTASPSAPLWKTTIPNTIPDKSQYSDDVRMSVNGDILFPVILDCEGCLWSAGDGNAKVYRVNTSGNVISSCNLGQVKAFDLKLRIHPTADGGFAAVSSKASSMPMPAAPSTGCSFDRTFWNTDAYVGKCNSCGNLEWETTFDVDGSAPAPAYPGNVKKQECLYSISQAADGGFVISGNNSFNFDDDYLAKLLPASSPTSSLFIADTPQDIGLEPNPDNGPMWVSDDIWVRNLNDGLLTHQNPIALQPNYVNVRVRNKGCQPASATLRLYWAKASTGLGWPNQWVNNTTTQPGCSATSFGDMVTSAPIAIGPIAPNGATIIPVQWTPPDPADYSCFGADQGHFCLLARVETSTITPYGMTFPETTDVFTNVKNNSRIAWKNVSVMELNPKQKRKAWSIVRNVSERSTTTRLSFEVPKTESGRSFYRYGSVEVNLGRPLIRKWVNGGMVGKGIRRVDMTTIRVLGPDGWIGNITLDPNEMHTISLLFRLQTQPPKRGKNTFAVDLVQTDAAFGSGSVDTIKRGGVRFSIDTGKIPPKRHASVWRSRVQ